MPRRISSRGGRIIFQSYVNECLFKDLDGIFSFGNTSKLLVFGIFAVMFVLLQLLLLLDPFFLNYFSCCHLRINMNLINRFINLFSRRILFLSRYTSENISKFDFRFIIPIIELGLYKWNWTSLKQQLQFNLNFPMRWGWVWRNSAYRELITL